MKVGIEISSNEVINLDKVLSVRRDRNKITFCFVNLQSTTITLGTSERAQEYYNKVLTAFDSVKVVLD